MADYIYRRPTEEDILYLSAHLRKEDRRELVGMVGPDIEREIRHCVETSDTAYACCLGGKTLAAFGVICKNPFERHGIIWMLASEETAKHKIYTGKWTRRGIKAFLQDWEVLYNFVDEGNTETIKWLKWIGAEVYPPEPRGFYGINYHLFVFRRK